MNGWEFKITREAELDLGKLDSEVKKRVTEKLHWLIKNFEYITPLPLGESLKGFFKLRVGDWRIVYDFDTTIKIVTVHAIDRRDKIYKKLKS